MNLAFMTEHPNASMPFVPGYEEDYFLRSLALRLDMIEPKGNNCTEVLVWHTQTKNHELTTVQISHEYLDNRSNLGLLFESLSNMGVAKASDRGGERHFYISFMCNFYSYLQGQRQLLAKMENPSR